MKIKDGDWTLYEADPTTGRSVWYLYDERGRQIFRTSYNVDSLVTENTRVRNLAQQAWSGDYHRVASIPLNVLYDKQTGLHDAFMARDDKFTSRWLNDSDNRAWRTKEGTV